MSRWSSLASSISTLRGSLACLALALGLAACSDSSTGITEQDIACPTDSTLTYANYGQAAITTWCLDCHNRERPVLSTQAQVKAATSQIISEAVFSSAMPEDKDMSLDERKKLGQWLRCGAP